ncbi:MAG TPA: TniB family NTP-binding protein [Candidatus Tectomicrobia bacterium]
MTVELWRAAPDLSHLTATAQTAGVLPDAERIARIRAERWIGYSRAREALAKLEDLLTHPVRQRMPNLLLIGPTNNGKSMLMEKFRRAHRVESALHAETETIPVVTMQMPSDPSVSRFYALLLTTLGVPLHGRRKVVDLEGMALRVLRAVGMKVLVIDELHNMLAGNSSVRREFLNLLRFLGNELRVPIVGVGTREAYLAIRSDDQLENRFEPMTLPLWQDGPELMALLASYAASFPLRQRSTLDQPALASYILARTEGTIGEITMFLTRAAIAAIDSGEEALTRKTLMLAEYASPSERRSTFEREIR